MQIFALFTTKKHLSYKKQESELAFTLYSFYK